jgi:hypothetical protein
VRELAPFCCISKKYKLVTYHFNHCPWPTRDLQNVYSDLLIRSTSRAGDRCKFTRATKHLVVRLNHELQRAKLNSFCGIWSLSLCKKSWRLITSEVSNFPSTGTSLYFFPSLCTTKYSPIHHFTLLYSSTSHRATSQALQCLIIFISTRSCRLSWCQK